jgi:hypothetical protein
MRGSLTAILVRTLVVAVMLTWAVPAASLGHASAQSAGAGALGMVPATKIVVFHPAGSSGRTVQGACDMGESLATARADAWRCMVGNDIYDPCFSAAPHATSVICDASPTKPRGMRVHLPRPLPTHAPARGMRAWILELGDGTICGFVTGATGGVGDQRLNYGCANGNYVLGDPQSAGKIWYATEVKLSNKSNSSGFIPSRIFAISVAEIWK